MLAITLFYHGIFDLKVAYQLYIRLALKSCIYENTTFSYGIRCFKFSTLDNMSLVMKNPAFCICEKDADQLRGYREADQRLCYRYIVQSFYFLNTKFQASSHLLWLYNSVCVGPGRKPGRPVFSQQGSYTNFKCSDTGQFCCKEPKI